MLVSLILLLQLGTTSTPPPQGVEDLHECAATAVAPRNGWQRISEGDFVFEMPTGFKLVAEARFVHGGRAWADHDRQVTASWGSWGLGSFGDAPAPNMCRFVCGRLQAVRLDAQSAAASWAAVWLLRSGSPHELVVSARGPSATDRELLNAIVLSLCDAK